MCKFFALKKWRMDYFDDVIRLSAHMVYRTVTLIEHSARLKVIQ